MDSHSVQCEAKAVAQDLRTVSGGLDIDRYEDILIYRDTQKVDNIFVSLDFTILPKTCFLVQPAPCKTISIKVYHAMGQSTICYMHCVFLFLKQEMLRSVLDPRLHLEYEVSCGVGGNGGCGGGDGKWATGQATWPHLKMEAAH